MRTTALRGLAAIFALTWLVLPGFGLIDLAVTWSPDWPQVLEAGWGVYFTFLVGAPFLLVAVRPERMRVAAVQAAITAAVLGVSALAADERQLWWVPVALTIETAVLIVLGRTFARRAVWPAPAPLMLVLVLLGAVPWLLYADQMYAANREGRLDADITNGIDHYSVQGALGVGVVALSSVAALWPEGRRFTGTCVGIAAAYLGLVSVAWPGSAGGFAAGWSIAAIGWGLVLASLAWLDRPAVAER